MLNQNLLPKTSKQISDEADTASASAFLRQHNQQPNIPIGEVPEAVDRNAHLLPRDKGEKQFLDELSVETGIRDKNVEESVKQEAGKLVAGAELLVAQAQTNGDEPHPLPFEGDTHEISIGNIRQQAQNVPEDHGQQVA